MHYERMRTHGTTEQQRPYCSVDTAEERLSYYGWSEIVVVAKLGACWEWLGHRNDEGYGGARFRGKYVRTHRLAYETWVGPIPEGLLIRHRCDNPPCINPEHLVPGTHKDNSQDALERGRLAPVHGFSNNNSKITEESAARISLDSTNPLLTQRMIADLYGVNVGTIQRHVKGRRGK